MVKDSFTINILPWQGLKDFHINVTFLFRKVFLGLQAMLKLYVRTLLSGFIASCMLSVAVPLHSIVHEHYFVHQDTCGPSCEKHLKNYTKPCCTTSDAVLIGELPFTPFTFDIIRAATELETVYHTANYFQFFHLTRNKAPPTLS